MVITLNFKPDGRACGITATYELPSGRELTTTEHTTSSYSLQPTQLSHKLETDDNESVKRFMAATNIPYKVLYDIAKEIKKIVEEDANFKNPFAILGE